MHQLVNIIRILHFMSFRRQFCVVYNLLQIILQIFVIYGAFHIRKQFCKCLCVIVIFCYDR